eukprot:Rhum_TRINITY_DN8946_c0_g1::Rhum_TRINITY_DN8946_c0_g1_i1::g.30779::m.30779
MSNAGSVARAQTGAGADAASPVAPTPSTVSSGNQCAICFSALTDGVTLDPCEHSICGGCFASWASTCRCAVPGVPPECVHCATGKVECPFCRVLTTHPSSSENDKRRRKVERDQRHALRQARRDANTRWSLKTFTITKSSESAIGVRFRGKDIIEVVDRSPAHRAGLKAGMRIKEVGGTVVDDNSDSVHEALSASAATFVMKVAVPEPQEQRPAAASAAAVDAPAAAAAAAAVPRAENRRAAEPAPAAAAADAAREREREREVRQRERESEKEKERERVKERNLRLKRYFDDQQQVMDERRAAEKREKLRREQDEAVARHARRAPAAAAPLLQSPPAGPSSAGVAGQQDHGRLDHLMRVRDGELKKLRERLQGQKQDEQAKERAQERVREHDRVRERRLENEKALRALRLKAAARGGTHEVRHEAPHARDINLRELRQGMPPNGMYQNHHRDPQRHLPHAARHIPSGPHRLAMP